MEIIKEYHRCDNKGVELMEKLQYLGVAWEHRTSRRRRMKFGNMVT